MIAFTKNASRWRISQSGPAATIPTPMPASVAASKRATAFPRRPSSPIVAIAMKPRIDGTLAAVEAPSSQRVPPSSQRFVVIPVRTTAVAPNAGPSCMIRWYPNRSASEPKIGDRISSAAKNDAVNTATVIEDTCSPPCLCSSAR